LYSKARADQPTFEPIQSIEFDGIPVNNASVPPPHEVLQDGKAVNPLQTPANSQAAPTPALPVPREDFEVPTAKLGELGRLSWC
jgi:hypothetical protein